MKIVNVYEAKTHLSRLLDQVAQGEEITIARAGRPVARLVAYRPTAIQRQPGIWRGQVWVAADFDQTDAKLIELFETGE